MGEIFYEGRMVRLENASENELKEMFDKHQEKQAKLKDEIDNCLAKMMNL